MTRPFVGQAAVRPDDDKVVAHRAGLFLDLRQQRPTFSGSQLDADQGAGATLVLVSVCSRRGLTR
jgi:hypothetical protein